MMRTLKRRWRIRRRWRRYEIKKWERVGELDAVTQVNVGTRTDRGKWRVCLLEIVTIGVRVTCIAGLNGIDAVERANNGVGIVNANVEGENIREHDVFALAPAI